MKIPLEWLREFVVIDMEPHELALSLTMRGLEVESVEEQKPLFHKVVVGKIVEIQKHPHAENLSICRVDTGGSVVPVVCGATNILHGHKVPLAVEGAKLADGSVIERKDIKGVASAGTLCSERQLGLSDDHSGIFVLPDSCRMGEPLAETLGSEDFIFDINVAPNRGDLLSVYGIAREAGSILGQKAKLPIFRVEEDQEQHIDDYMSLSVLDVEACPRYVLRMIKGVSIIPSPFWMKSRLVKCGMRPINCIVDVTNYVMLELGQPLHSFDYRALRQKRIEVRLAAGDTTFRTLDGEDRKLLPGDILICDGEGPVAIAGIMGGENSEIIHGTEDIALESAFFNPLHIRQTARRLNLRSEASQRFEKGVDIDQVDFAAERAIFLMNMLSGGTVVQGKKEIYEKKERRSIFVSFGRINDILGTPIEHTEVVGALRSVDLYVTKEEEQGFVVSIPNFRYDITEYMDIIEEVARIRGYDHIAATTPVSTLQPQTRDRKDVYVRVAKDYFTSLGFYELINFAFFSARDAQNFLLPSSDERASYVNIVNPISKEFECMRTIMAPGVLRSIAYNLNRGSKNLRFFEMGTTFLTAKDGLPAEYPSLCFAITGKEREFFWRDPQSLYDFYDIKGILEGLAERFSLGITLRGSEEPFLDSGSAADVWTGDTKSGWIGEIDDEVLRSYEIEQKVYCAELRFDIIQRMGDLTSQYRPMPRYPQVTRDFSFYISDRLQVSGLIERIRQASPLILSVGVFDMFKKERRSISFRVVFQSFEDTLKDETVNELQEVIIRELTDIKGVTLRT